MFGCSSRPMARTSCLNRAAFASQSFSAGSTFSATTLPSSTCRALYTAPMPPLASDPRISYCPSRLNSNRSTTDAADDPPRGGCLIRARKPSAGSKFDSDTDPTREPAGFGVEPIRRSSRSWQLEQRSTCASTASLSGPPSCSARSRSSCRGTGHTLTSAPMCESLEAGTGNQSNPNATPPAKTGGGGHHHVPRTLRVQRPVRRTVGLLLRQVGRRHGHLLTVGRAGNGRHRRRGGERRLGDVRQVALSVLLGQERVPLRLAVLVVLEPAPVNLGRGVVVVHVPRLARVVDGVVVAVGGGGRRRVVVVGPVVVPGGRVIRPRGVILPVIAAGLRLPGQGGERRPRQQHQHGPPEIAIHRKPP